MHRRFGANDETAGMWRYKKSPEPSTSSSRYSKRKAVPEFARKSRALRLPQDRLVVPTVQDEASSPQSITNLVVLSNITARADRCWKSRPAKCRYGQSLKRCEGATAPIRLEMFTDCYQSNLSCPFILIAKAMEPIINPEA